MTARSAKAKINLEFAELVRGATAELGTRMVTPEANVRKLFG